MADTKTDEVPLTLVQKLDGVVEKQKYRGSITIPKDPPSKDLGEWEYVIVARLPSLDVTKTGDKPLDVSLPGEMVRLDIMIDPDAPEAHDALVTLTGSDGYQRTLSIVEQGKAHAHVKGMTAVYFDGLKIGVKYSCSVDPGNHGAPYNVFQDVTLTQDHVLKPADAAQAKQQMATKSNAPAAPAAAPNVK